MVELQVGIISGELNLIVLRIDTCVRILTANPLLLLIVLVVAGAHIIALQILTLKKIY
jgi:hypothetical protein